MTTLSVVAERPVLRAGETVWGAQAEHGALHVRADCPRLLLAAIVDRAVVVRVEESRMVTAAETLTGHLRQGPPCRQCGWRRGGEGVPRPLRVALEEFRATVAGRREPMVRRR